MTARDVLKYDFRRVRRSWGPAVAGLAYAVAVGFVVVTQSSSEDIGQVLLVVTGLTTFAVPIIALSVSVSAVAGERDSRTARLQLGLPNSRRAFVLGKLASRLLVITGVVGIPAVGSSALLVSTYGVVWAPTVGVYWLVSLMLGSAYTCIGICLSSAVRSKATAAGSGLAVYFLSVFAWSPMSFISIPRILEGEIGSALPTPPGASLFVESLSPVTAYTRALELAATRLMLIQPAPDTVTLLQPPVMLLILAIWCCLTIVVSIRRFQRADLE